MNRDQRDRIEGNCCWACGAYLMTAETDTVLFADVPMTIICLR